MATAAPPAYSEPILEPNGDFTTPRQENDNVPDDFKWSDVVAECAIDIRHRFMQRVYTILVAQLLVTVFIGGLIILNTSVHKWVLSNSWAVLVAVIGSFGTLIAAMVWQRTYPWNLALLGTFTVFEGYLVGVASLAFDTQVVVNTLIVTAIVFAGLSVFALQTKYDFTSWYPYLSAALFGLIGFGFVMMFLPTSGVEMGYSIIAVIIFCGYILVDTQLVLTRFHPDDEVAASITLYLDIINLFINLLRIINGQSN